MLATDPFAALRNRALKDAYGEDNRLRIKGAISDNWAAALSQHLSEQAEWAVSMARGGLMARLSPQTLAAYPDEQRKSLTRDLYKDASQGQGYIYESIPLEPAGNSLAEQLLGHMKSPEMLSWMSDLTGHELRDVNGQATQYRPGHWLTRHRDDPLGETRRVAYVLSLSPHWHGDWGGLLQFYADDGTPRDAWAPELATLSLFDVRHVHAVTYIAPYALAPRYSITGWFNT